MQHGLAERRALDSAVSACVSDPPADLGALVVTHTHARARARACANLVCASDAPTDLGVLVVNTKTWVSVHVGTCRLAGSRWAQ